MIRRLMALLLFVCLSPTISYAGNQMFVTMGDNTVVTYDVSQGSATAVAASAQVFTSTNLDNPYGLAFDSSGNLFTANYGNNTISKYSSTGVFLSSFGTANLNKPNGLAFDGSGNLYAANYGSDSISKFSPSGVYLNSIGSVTNLNNPRGLAFDSFGNLYSSMGLNATGISKFNSAGVFQNYIGSSINLNRPWDLSFDSAGNLYATNFWGNTISKFNSFGVFQSSFGSGNVNAPVGLAFDGSGNLYVANLTGSISKFSPSGNFLFSWSTPSQARSIAFSSSTVPEPSSYALMVSALLVAACRKRFSRFCKI